MSLIVWSVRRNFVSNPQELGKVTDVVIVMVEKMFEWRVPLFQKLEQPVDDSLSVGSSGKI